MLNPQQRLRIGEIDRRHTIILMEDGIEYIPAFQFGEDGRLREDVVYINEEIGADISPWLAIMLWTVEGTLEVARREQKPTFKAITAREALGWLPKELILRAMMRIFPIR